MLNGQQKTNGWKQTKGEPIPPTGRGNHVEVLERIGDGVVLAIGRQKR